MDRSSENKEYRSLEEPVGDTEYKHYSFDVEEYRELKKRKANDYNLWPIAVENVYPNILDEADYKKQDSCKIYCKSLKIKRKRRFEKGSVSIVQVLLMSCCYMGTI